MKKPLRYILITTLIVPLLFACETNTDGSSDSASEDASSTSELDISSSDTASDTSSTSDNPSSSSINDYEDADGYQYPINEDEEDYWYDTGIDLSVGVNYHGSNLLEVLRRGDIIFEATGFYGITGHVAIVEGIYYSNEYHQYYVRIIEAISVGVARSILTPTRMIEKEGSIYRLNDVSETEIEGAMSFILSQLGKPYAVEYGKSFSSDSPNWYCSEIIWAAYYLQGLNLDDDNLDSPVTPREIIESSLVSLVSLA